MSKRQRKEPTVEAGAAVTKIAAAVGIATSSPAKKINSEMHKAAERGIAKGLSGDELRRRVHGARIKGLGLPTATLHVTWKARAKALRQEHPDPKMWSPWRIATEIAIDYGVSPRSVYEVIRFEID